MKKEEIEQQIEELRTRLGEMGEEAEAEYGPRARKYAQMLREKGRFAFGKAKEYGGKVEDYAEHHPWVMMGAGLAVGLIVGMVLSKKKHHCDYC